MDCPDNTGFLQTGTEASRLGVFGSRPSFLPVPADQGTQKLIGRLLPQLSARRGIFGGAHHNQPAVSGNATFGKDGLNVLSSPAHPHANGLSRTGVRISSL